jgi:hypothetical protein
VREPGDLTVDEADLWRSSQPRFGVVRAVIVGGDYAIVLDDVNSDYRVIELTALRRAEERWRAIFYQDDAGLPDVGHTHSGGWCASISDGGGYGWTFGREHPGTKVQLRYRGELVEVVADAVGWWMCFRATADQQFDAPFRVG